MIQEDIFNAISTSGAVVAIAGSRIYPIRLPREAVLPAVVYQVQGADPVATLDGDSRLDNNVIEIVAWAKDYATAQALVAAVRASLASLMVTVEDQGDGEDLDTRNYSVSLIVRAWSQV
jgi:hypothetical protein